MRKKIIALIIGAAVLSMAMTNSAKAYEPIDCFTLSSGCQRTTPERSCNGSSYFEDQNDCINHMRTCDDTTCEKVWDTGLLDKYVGCSCQIGVTEEEVTKTVNLWCQEGGSAIQKPIQYCASADDVYGDIGNPINGGSFGSDVKSGLMGFVNTIINFITFLAGGLLLLVMIVSGIRVIIGGKDAKVLGENMKRILFAAIGLVIVMLAYVITGFISGLLFGDETLLNPVVNGPS